jgi:hypothetical protein
MPHDILLHPGAQHISLSKLLSQVPFFLSQGNQFFFGSHAPPVLVSGLPDKSFSTRELLECYFSFLFSSVLVENNLYFR